MRFVTRPSSLDSSLRDLISPCLVHTQEPISRSANRLLLSVTPQSHTHSHSHSLSVTYPYPRHSDSPHPPTPRPTPSRDLNCSSARSTSNSQQHKPNSMVAVSGPSLFFFFEMNGLTNTHPRVNHSRRPFVIPVVFLLTPFRLHSASLFLYLFVCPVIVAYPPHPIVSLWHPLCYVMLRYAMFCLAPVYCAPHHVVSQRLLSHPRGIINSQPVSPIQWCDGDKRINIKYEKYTSTRYVKHQTYINKTLNESQKVQTVKKAIKYLIV